MRTEVPALLSEFFGPHGGCVLYKAYYPQRGDDVAALVDLAVALPSNVRFLPVSPTVETIHDIRRMLPMFLADLGIVREAAAPKRLSDEAREQAEETLLLLIKRTFERVPGLGVTPEQCLAKLKQHDDALTLLLRMTDPEIMPPPEVQAKHEHTTRLPDHGPILILGRPDMILDYHVENSEMHRLLDAAGYPNRFEFVGSADEILSSAEVMRDRKTRLRYRRQVRRKDDVGFIFRGRTPHGQTVLVIEGGTSLGTYAGVRVLIHPSAIVEEAVTDANANDACPPIDIGFRCELREEARAAPFPLAHEPRRLKVEILNPDDVSGFRWARRATELLEPMLDAWDQPCNSGPCLLSARSVNDKTYMEWRCKTQSVLEGGPARVRILPVEIRTRAYRISDQQVVRPSWRFGELLDQVVADLKKDRDRWRRRLGVWLVNSSNRSIIRGMDCDPTRETLRPILLIGPTGAGKEFVTRLIARGWNGRILPLDEVGVTDAQLRKDRNAYLESAQAVLDDLAKEWLDSDGAHMPFDQLFHTLSPVAVPDTLLNSEMFGIAGNIAADSTTAVGAFTGAGTGILFLDEMLELDPTLQSRFLVALQNAQVSPIGARKAYSYLCRVVAATNKAHNTEQLWKLAESRGVRNDLVSRFSRRYEIPSLSERAPEIITGLMEMVRQELVNAAREDTLADDESGNVDANAVRSYLRISRPAFEALISHHFEDNFRGLKRVFDTLPTTMVRSFAQTLSGSSLSDIIAGSIRLEHLRTLLGVRREEAIANGNPHLSGEQEEETDFYEFFLGKDLADECDPAPSGSEPEDLPAVGLNLDGIDPDKHEAYKAFHSGISNEIQRFQSLRAHARKLFGEDFLTDTPDPKTLTAEKLTTFFDKLDEQCSADLSTLMQVVLDAFAETSAPSQVDLTTAFSRSLWPKGTFPLRAFMLDVIDQTTRETIAQRANHAMMAVIRPLLKKPDLPDPETERQAGRPRGLTQKTVLALLAGGWK